MYLNRIVIVTVTPILMSFRQPRTFSTFKTLIFVGAALSIAGTILLWHPTLPSKFPLWNQHCQPVEENHSRLAVLSIPVKRRNVVVASRFGYHFDVYMALVWTLERVTNSSIHVFPPDGFRFGFDDVVRNLGLHSGSSSDSLDLPQAVSNNSAIDMVVLGTCEIECIQFFLLIATLMTFAQLAC